MKKRMIKFHTIIQGQVGFRYGDIGHGFTDPRNLLWWWDGTSDRIHRRQDRGGTFHCDVVPTVDNVWRGRIEFTGRASILPPLHIFAYTPPDKLLVPARLVHRLRALGAVYFYVDSKAGLRRLQTNSFVTISVVIP